MPPAGSSSAAAPCLLLATTGSFYPPYHGDSVRLYNMITWFRGRGWQVHVVHWHSPDHKHADYQAMGRLSDGLSVYYPDAAWPPLGSVVCDDWCLDGFRDLVARQYEKCRPHVVMVQYVFLSKCLKGLPGSVIKVIDADNVFSGRRELWEAEGFEYDWFSTNPEEEYRGLSRADLLVSVQEAEAAVIARLAPDRPVILVPPAEPAVACGGSDRQELLFVSGLDAVNLDGIRRFIDDVLPGVRRRHPRTRLLVAGSVADGLAGSAPAVVRLGVVPDVRPLYDRACIVLNTTAVGTGIKSKTVRALCHGKCLVSTPAGVEGLERYPGIFYVADSAADFGDIVSRLLDDRDLIRATGRRALEFASWYFDPDTVYGRLERAFLGAAVQGASRNCH